MNDGMQPPIVHGRCDRRHGVAGVLRAVALAVLY
jgi:hypothetical protein